jgi:chondroitin-sulfate-ABC endolyase/exolyase
MKKILLLFITLLFACSGRLSSQIYSFEDGLVPAEWTVSSGTLTTTDVKYKLGTKSLCWTWNVNSLLTVTTPPGLDVASTNSSGGIYMWIYNTTAHSGKLVFSFLNSSNQVKCSINFNLNFTGWRCFTASFTEDMKHNKSLLTKMTIQAPSTIGGTFYLDHIEFRSGVSWDRLSDAQCTITQNTAAFDFWGIRQNGNFPATVPVATSTQVVGVDTILQRLDDWYLGKGKYASNTYFKYRKSAIDGIISKTNSYNYLISNFKSTSSTTVGTTVTGEGLYPENLTSVNGVSLKNFRDVAEGPMLWMAYDYRINANRADSKTRWLNMIDWFNDQGFADGSSMGGLYGERLRSTGYFNSIILMRKELDATRAQRELNTLDWFSLWGNTNMPFNVGGDNADHIRALSIAKLAYVAIQPDANKRVYAMTNLKNYFNNAFSIAPGFADTFKPDFSGYHHCGTYLTQYYPDALYAASLMYYLLHDTPYALSDSVYSILKNCLLTWRLTASLYDVPIAACGRFPTGEVYVDEILPAYALLALSRPQPDAELLSAFARVWKPTESPLIDQLKKATVGISHRTTYGETEICLQAVDLKPIAESNPKTTLYLPYSGLMINRNNSTHVTIKGFSKFIWDYESGLPGENLYGRYLSYGQIEFANLSTSKKNNNYSNANWDWSRLPGTTTKYLSTAALTYTSSVSHRNFSNDPFLGGVTLNDSTSFFSMKLHDTAFDNTFYAYKSVFYCGNVLLSLGSNISNSDNSNRTETTLFQQVLGSGESISVNGTTFSANQSNLSKPVIKDNLGCRFIVKAGSVDVSTANSIYTAVINHGYAPANQSYSYFMLFNGTDAQETKYKTEATCPVKIVRQDNVAHIVKKPDDKVFAYAIFNQNTALNDSIVNQVNTPSLVMFKIIDSTTFRLSISDPDMHRTSAGNLDALSPSVTIAPSGSFNYQIILNGLFKLDGNNPNVSLTNSGNTTKINLSVVDGKTYQIPLKSISTSLDTVESSKNIQITGMPSKNEYLIQTKDYQQININIYSVDGKIVYSAGNFQTPYILNLNSLNKGVFLIIANNNNYIAKQKIIIQ